VVCGGRENDGVAKNRRESQAKGWGERVSSRSFPWNVVKTVVRTMEKYVPQRRPEP